MPQSHNAVRRKPTPKEWIHQQILWAEVLEDLDREFSRMGIRYMPIKGAYLICTGLAAKLASRTMADIDLLVLPEDFERACRGLEATGKTRPKKPLWDQTWEFEREYEYGEGLTACHVEIHKLINYEVRFLLPPKLLFERGVATSSLRVLPSAEDALLIHICHTLVHIVYCIKDTSFEETGLISAQAGFSWEEFWRRAKGTGVMGFCRFYIEWCKKTVGLQVVLPRGWFPYSTVMGRCAKIETYLRVDASIRRLLLELPMVRSPLWLLLRRSQASIRG
jgi:hypothetical protein